MATCFTPTTLVLRTFALLSLAMFLDKADQQLLPAVFLQVCGDLDAGPSLLGTITLCRGLAMSLIALAAGPLSKRYDRVSICAFGVGLWGVATAAVGLAPSIWLLLIGRTINGLGLGLVIPVVFALVADMFPPSQRGAAFGILSCCSNFGGMSGSLLATELGASIVVGMAGWRAAFHMVALASLAVALLLLLFARDPQPRSTTVDTPLSCATALADLRTVLRLPTFGIILAQGAFGTVPWYSIGFFVMWLQLSGHSNHASALIRLAFDLGVTVGGLAGGFLNDYAARRSPDHGRVVVAQVSVGSGVPLFLIVLLVLPTVGAADMAYYGVLLLTGGLISWCSSVNNAIMAEITPSHLRPTIYGLDRTLEGIIAPAGTALVGLLAEHLFGFTTADSCELPADGNASAAGAATADDAAGGVSHNATALAKALAAMMATPWTICFVAYSFMHRTYPVDRRRAGALVWAHAPASADASSAPNVSSEADGVSLVVQGGRAHADDAEAAAIASSPTASPTKAEVQRA